MCLALSSAAPTPDAARAAPFDTRRIIAGGASVRSCLTGGEHQALCGRNIA